MLRYAPGTNFCWAVSFILSRPFTLASQFGYGLLKTMNRGISDREERFGYNLAVWRVLSFGAHIKTNVWWQTEEPSKRYHFNEHHYHPKQRMDWKSRLWSVIFNMQSKRHKVWKSSLCPLAKVVAPRIFILKRRVKLRMLGLNTISKKLYRWRSGLDLTYTEQRGL